MLDVLVFGAHPDDCEIFMGGTILYMKSLSYNVGVCDCCSGEAGTYGSSDTRRQELENAGKVLGLDARETLDMPDGNIRNTEENRLKVIDVIRKYRPQLVFSFHDHKTRHPDHGHVGDMVRECSYLSGLEKIETGNSSFRPSSFISFPELIQYRRPDFVVDVTDFWERKLEALRCYHSQVTLPGEDDSSTKTFIRSNRFWSVLEARSTMAGAMIGAKYGEPYFSVNPPRITDPLQSLRRGFG